MVRAEATRKQILVGSDNLRGIVMFGLLEYDSFGDPSLYEEVS